MAAKQKQEAQQQQPAQVAKPVPQAAFTPQTQAASTMGGGTFTISDCDLGASPVMKAGLFKHQ